MENPSSSPKLADGKGEAAPFTQMNWTEDAPMPSHEVQQPVGGLHGHREYR
jgi:hypothetical protein